MSEIICAIGLMSGTSLDGVDAALIYSDGESHIKTGGAIAMEYPDAFRAQLHRLVSGDAMAAADIARIERELTLYHAEAVNRLLNQESLTASEVDLLGFHGQTIAHDPAAGYTMQIGDGALLAKETGIGVICDFRSADVAMGGQGAPLVPLYHAALAKQAGLDLPAAIVNIGGVANVTYIGDNGELLAFDTGPGNALINDWVQRHFNCAYDEDGKIAASGAIDESIVQRYLAHEYFAKPAPKSLDRQDFSCEWVEGLSPEDGAATLTELTARSIAKGYERFPEPAHSAYICGGGRHNQYLMQRLSQHLKMSVHSVEGALNTDGDMLEAQAFAYLAIRSKKGLPTSLPQTTGAARAVVGGVFYPV